MSLGVLVIRFGEYVREYAPVQPDNHLLEEPFPHALVRVREEFNHHLIPLLLLSRSDGETVDAERLVILQYCVERASQASAPFTHEEEQALASYLLQIRPNQSQLGAAVNRLQEESKESIAGLIEAAIMVVDADRERRIREMHFLNELLGALSKV